MDPGFKERVTATFGGFLHRPPFDAVATMEAMLRLRRRDHQATDSLGRGRAARSRERGDVRRPVALAVAREQAPSPFSTKVS